MTGDLEAKDKGVRRRRTGRAEARLRLPDDLRDQLENGDDETLEVMTSARTAGELAVRRVPQVVPKAADTEIAGVTIQHTWTERGLQIAARVEGFARAPLNGRAMAAVQVFVLTLAEAYPRAAEHFEISEKAGGEAAGDGRDLTFDPPVRAAVVVISDAVASGDKEDRAGDRVRAAIDALTDRGIERVSGEVLSDDEGRIAETVRALVDDGVELVVTVGGTGVTHTDCTVEVLAPMIENEIPGIMEAARQYGLERTPYAIMSRGVAGLIEDTLVVTFPGSSSGAEETCEALFPDILHVIRTRRRSRRELT